MTITGTDGNVLMKHFVDVNQISILLKYYSKLDYEISSDGRCSEPLCETSGCKGFVTFNFVPGNIRIVDDQGIKEINVAALGEMKQNLKHY